MLVNLIESLVAMISIQNHLKKKVNVIIFIYGHHTIVYIILVPFNVCYSPNTVHGVRPLHDLSGYVYCTDRNKGIKQLCPPGTEVLYVQYEIYGCVNKTSKCKTK
jgi:hypothetical protein